MSDRLEKSYAMTAEEAEITAKWQLGIRNAAQPLSLALLAAVALVEVARRLTRLPLPDWSFIAADAVAVMLFVACLYLIDKRVKERAAAIAQRRITLIYDGGRLALAEGGRRIYECGGDEITRVEAGPRVVRITSEAGSICIPRSALSDELVAALRERLGKQGFKIYNWM